MEKKTNVLEESEKRRIVAYRLAGFAVTNWFLEHTDQLFKVSIIPTSEYLGYVQLESKEWHLCTKEQLFDNMSMWLAYVVTERIFFKKWLSNGLKEVVESVYKQVVGIDKKIDLLSFDMSQLGDVTKKPYSEDIDLLNKFYCRALKLIMKPYEDVEKVVDMDEKICLLQPGDIVINKPYSEATSQIILNQVMDLFKKLYCRTIKLLMKHKKEVEKVALCLLDKEILARDDIIELLGPRPFKAKSNCGVFGEGIGSKGLGGISMLPNVASWLQFLLLSMQQHIESVIDLYSSSVGPVGQ